MEKLLTPIRNFLEFIKEPLLAVLAALLITQFLFAHTRIPTPSMEPTIMTGDHMIINRLPYYYRDPVRNEIVIFKHDGDLLVKRLIGEPGDTIDLIDGHVYVNDELLDESAYLSPSVESYPLSSSITFPFVVPEGHYFMMGDNRTRSADSRMFGPISRDVIVAQGGFRIYPFNNIGIIH